MRRAVRALALALIALALVLGLLGVILALRTESALGRAVYVADVVIVLAVMTGLSVVIWPRGAR